MKSCVVLLVTLALAGVVSANFFRCSDDKTARGEGCSCCRDPTDGQHTFRYKIKNEKMKFQNITSYITGAPLQRTGLCVDLPLTDLGSDSNVGSALGCFFPDTFPSDMSVATFGVGASTLFRDTDRCSRGNFLVQSNDGFQIAQLGSNSNYNGIWTHTGNMFLKNVGVPSQGTGLTTGLRADWDMRCLFDMRNLSPAGQYTISFDCIFVITLN